MIVCNWNPKTKLINGKQIKILYEKSIKFNSNTLTVWKCDDKNCKEPNKLHTIRYNHLKENKSKNCNLNIQICKSCQTKGSKNVMYGKTHTDNIKQLLRENIKKSQKTIKEKYNVDNISQLESIKEKKKQFILNFKNVKDLIEKDSYKLLDIKGNNKNSILKIKCKNNHTFNIKYHSWKRGHRCVKCYYDLLRNKGINDITGFKKYNRLVTQETKKSYRLYKHIINPLNYTLGRNKYHLDHKFSILEGFKQNIDYKIIGSLYNLEVITEHDNCSKQSKCSITKEDLLSGYFREVK